MARQSTAKRLALLVRQEQEYRSTDFSQVTDKKLSGLLMNQLVRIQTELDDLVHQILGESDPANG